VVEVAIGCIVAEGPQALGINSVARAIGIRPPSLYHYISSNEDLRLEVCLEGWRRAIDSLSYAVYVAEKAGGDKPVLEFVTSKLRALVTALRKFSTDNPALHMIMYTVQIPPADQRALDLKARALAAFQRALAPHPVERETLIHLMRTVRASTHGFIALQSAGLFPYDPPPDQSFEWMEDTLLRGIVEKLGIR
jgi:AcrR family transcriptional regulator